MIQREDAFFLLLLLSGVFRRPRHACREGNEYMTLGRPTIRFVPPLI